MLVQMRWSLWPAKGKDKGVDLIDCLILLQFKTLRKTSWNAEKKKKKKEEEEKEEALVELAAWAAAKKLR